MAGPEALLAGGRRERRIRSDKPSRRWGLPLLLGALTLLLIFALDQRLRGPVAGSERLGGRRDDAHEARVERAFLNAQLQLAAGDSIGIVLDARTDRLWIVLKGVTLRECRLSDIQFDANILALVSGDHEADWLERPFILNERRGNLPDPWKPIAEGPVDTLKGAVAARELPMDGSLVFDRDLVLHITTPPTAADSLARRGVSGLFRRLGDRSRDAAAAWKEIVQGPATMDVYLHISREDAAAVLRALSVGGGMALRI
jgi:hypothetical protein